MNSENMPSTYANSNQVLYGAHYVELLSDFVSYESPRGKFSLSYITPNMDTTDEYNKTYPKENSSNVINKDHLGTTRITNTNYIELTVPIYFFYITDLKIEPNTTRRSPGVTYVNTVTGSADGDGSHSHSVSVKNNQWTLLNTCDPKIIISRKMYYKGQKFVVVNIGGEVENVVIIGVLE